MQDNGKAYLVFGISLHHCSLLELSLRGLSEICLTARCTQYGPTIFALGTASSIFHYSPHVTQSRTVFVQHLGYTTYTGCERNTLGTG